MSRSDHSRSGLCLLAALVRPAVLAAAVLGLVLAGPDALAERGAATLPRLPGAVPRANGVPPLTGEFAAREELRPAIEFWKKIFGLYTTDQAVIHHAYRLDVVYSVLDFSDLEGNPSADRIRRARTRAEIGRIQAMLRRMRDPGARKSLSEKERRIYDKLRSAPGGIRAAALEENIHVQSGISDRFEEGLVVSRRYLPEIEAIFREEGLPLQLTRMPFVESTFNVRAHSKAAASGIWQFIPSTGRLYMRVGNAVDERRDPIISSRAAAKLLEHNYGITRRWPLAVTAYNHGLGGVMRAVRATGSSDIAHIIENYQGSRFGYASRNFFVELLAALEVERDMERYFGRLNFPPPLNYDEIRLDRPLLARHLVESGIGSEELAELNPALSARTLQNYYSIPSGTIIRTPLGRGETIVARLNRLQAAEVRTVAASEGRHRVRRGETLSGLARRYGVSVRALARANRISSRAHLRIGQVLEVPESARRRVVRSRGGRSGHNAVFVRRADHGRAYAAAPPAASAGTRVAAESGSFDATAIALEASEGARRRAPARAAARPEPAPAVIPDPPATAEAPGEKEEGNGPALAKFGESPSEKRAPPVTTARVERAPEPAPRAPEPAPRGRPGKPVSSPGAVLGVEARARAAPSLAKDPPEEKATPAPPPSVTHVVRRNETLWLIAKKHGVSVADLRAANASKDLSPLIPGTRLVVTGGAARSGAGAGAAARHVTHVVSRNETLWLIAKKYGVSVSDIRAANAGRRLSPLMPGTRLEVPATGRTHIVKRNETLWSIARRYRVSLTALKAANAGKSLSPLKPGTELLIPG